MSPFPIKIDMPVIQRPFSASYSRVEKLSGVQYLLLKIIGTESFRDMAWRDVMDILRIPEEVYEKIFEEALNEMELSQVIKVRGGTDIDSDIGSMDFTPAGRQAFDKGVIAQKIENFRGTVAFMPSKAGKKFACASSLKILPPSAELSVKFEGMPSDALGMQAHVETEKKLYGVQDKDAEVFDIRFEDDGSLGSILADLRLSLNERTGEFEVSNNDTDDAFLKNNFESGQLIKPLPGTAFEPRNGLDIKAWRDSDPDWSSMTFYVPYDITPGGSDLVILDERTCRSGGEVSYAPLDGCDMAIIKSSELGYKYCFVKRPTAVTGFDGREVCRIAVRRTMGKAEIRPLVESVAKGIDVSDADGLAKALRMAEMMKDEDMMLSIVREHLTKVSVRTALKNLEKHSKKPWFGKIPEMLEEVLCDKGLDAQGILKEMQGTDVKLPGHEVLQRLKTGSAEADIVTADVLSEVLKDPDLAITELDLNEYIAASILAGESHDCKSRTLASASNAAKLLQKLKALFGMKSLSDYRLDLESFSPEDHGSIAKDIATFSSDTDKLKSVIGRTSGWSEISGYKEFFEGVGGFFSKKKGDRSTGMELGVRLEGLLRSMGQEGTMDEMLKNARDSELISENEYGLLHSLKLYRNDCAHQIDFKPADKKDLEKWKALVERMENERKEASP